MVPRRSRPAADRRQSQGMIQPRGNPWMAAKIDKPNTVLVIVGQPLRSRNGDAGLADTARSDKRD